MANFDYTARDYSSVREALSARASRSIPEWVGDDPSDFMSTLIDLWAYTADTLHYYIDRASTEAFLDTATQRESVLALANLYGYTPNYQRSATATLSLTNTGASSVTVPVNTKFISTTGQYFYNEEALSISGNSTGSLNVRQGTLVSSESLTSSTDSTRTSSDGTVGQRFNIYRTSVDPTTVRVFVAEGAGGATKEWSRVNTLVSYGPDDSVFSVYVDANQIAQVVFGNGLNGRIPPINAQITASYGYSDGSLGNVGSNTITRLATSSLPTITAITNVSPAAGGSDFEGIDSIKRAIPGALRTKSGATTLSDFRDLALATQGVSKATVSYTGSSASGASITATVVPDQTAYLTDGAASVSISTDLRDRVARELLNNALIGVTLISVPSSVTFTKIYVYFDLYVKSNYVQSVVVADVKNAVENLFAFTSVSFGQVVNIGEVYRTAMAVAGVDYLIVKGFTTTSGGTTTIDNSGKITVGATSLPKLGVVTITASGGVSAV